MSIARPSTVHSLFPILSLSSSSLSLFLFFCFSPFLYLISTQLNSTQLSPTQLKSFLLVPTSLISSTFARFTLRLLPRHRYCQGRGGSESHPGCSDTCTQPAPAHPAWKD
uniref:Uncharacterized protein n=1 Tax=Palpitomonas bilix TaxID=652834 RepID=A0A7S3DDA8_9EUKA|mmetsp:Transcript_32614/g.84230  ORF Transcript_32614/g.84230 Transcript_32614/m.84230 type:complete len:110 (+) Transcript_32614:521-850(+)